MSDYFSGISFFAIFACEILYPMAEKIINRYFFQSFLILTFVAVVVFFVTNSTPWLGDDTMYRFKINKELVVFERYGELVTSDESIEFVSDVKSLVESQNEHYMLINGRYSSHLMVQTVCGFMGQTVFAICNAIVWMLFICMLLKLCGKNCGDWRSLFMVVVLSFVSFVFKFTPSVQIGYIWIFTLALWFLKLLFGKELNRWCSVPLFLLGLIAGNGNETLSIGLSGALLLYLIKNGRHLSFQKWLMIAGYGLGTLVILCSPGSWTRVGELEPQPFSKLVGDFLLHIPALYVMLGIVVYRIITHRESLVSMIGRYYVFFTALLLCIVFCCMARTFDSRSLAGTNLMALVIALSMLKEKNIGRLWLAVGGLALVGICYVYYLTTIGQRHILEEVERQYCASEDGVTYVDTWPTTPLIAKILYVPHLSLYSYNSDKGGFSRDFALFETYLQKKYDAKKPLRIYPKYLEGRKDESLRSQIVEYYPGIYLVILRNGEERKVHVGRGFDFGLLVLPYDVFQPGLGTPVMQGRNWKAYIVYDDMYLVHNTHAYFE